MGCYETNNYNLKEDLYMSMMVGYYMGFVMLCVIVIACAIKFVYDMVNPEEPDTLYKDMKERIVNTLKEEQGLE